MITRMERGRIARSKLMDERRKNVPLFGSRAAYTVNKAATKAMEDKDTRIAQSEKTKMVKRDTSVAPQAELVESENGPAGNLEADPKYL